MQRVKQKIMIESFRTFILTVNFVWVPNWTTIGVVLFDSVWKTRPVEYSSERLTTFLAKGVLGFTDCKQCQTLTLIRQIRRNIFEYIQEFSRIKFPSSARDDRDGVCSAGRCAITLIYLVQSGSSSNAGKFAKRGPRPGAQRALSEFSAWLHRNKWKCKEFED